MARVENTNYRAENETDFYYATADDDPFDRDDVNKSAQALDRHDHSDTRGLAVARTGANSVSTTSIQNDAVVPDTKIPVITLDPATVPTDNDDRLTVLLSGIVNRMKTGFGTANWYDTPAKNLTEKVSKSGDQMTGPLVNFSDTRHGGTDAGVDGTMYQRAAFIASVASAYDQPDPTHPEQGAFPAMAWHREGVSASAVYHFQSGTGRLWVVGQDYPVTPVAQILTTLDEGAGNGIDADSLQTFTPSNESGHIPISNFSPNLGLRAEFADKLVDPVGATIRATGNGNPAVGNVAVSNGVLCTNLVAEFAKKALDVADNDHDFGNASGDIPISNSVKCTGLLAEGATIVQVPTPTGSEPGFASVGHALYNVPLSGGAAALNTGLCAEFLGGIAASGFNRLAANSYSGTGASVAMPIATGFVPKCVLIVQASDVNEVYIVLSNGGSTRLKNDGSATNVVTANTHVKLSTTDGFIVGDGDPSANAATKSYNWVAFG